MTVVDTITELRQALDTDEPIHASDDQLAELAELAAEELRRRLPRYALDQGDLDDDAEGEVEAREQLVAGIADYRSSRRSTDA